MKFEFEIHENEMQKLANLIRHLNTLGHNPSTSGNYSLRSDRYPEIALVSESGIDKSTFKASNFLPVIIETKKIHNDFVVPGRKSSDETEIHMSIYESTDAKCVLHSHLLESILFAELYSNYESASLTGLELLKAFKGIKTHEAEVIVPFFDNTQDIAALSCLIKKRIEGDSSIHGLLIRGHGLYCWGGSIDEAARHLETFSYIFNYYLKNSKSNR